MQGACEFSPGSTATVNPCWVHVRFVRAGDRGRRPRSQAAARTGPGDRHAVGLAADVLAVREQPGPRRAYRMARELPRPGNAATTGRGSAETAAVDVAGGVFFRGQSFLVRLDGALRPRRSSISWRPNRDSATWWRWAGTRCWCGTPNPRWRRHAHRARPAAEPSTSIPTPATRGHRISTRGGASRWRSAPAPGSPNPRGVAGPNSTARDDGVLPDAEATHSRVHRGPGYPAAHRSTRRPRVFAPRSVRTTTRIVSSPATVPTTSGQAARSSANASGGACPGSVFRTSRC